jgi:hypothetical protein
VIIRWIAWGFVCFALPAAAQWKPSNLDWDKAAAEMRRLPPSAFTALPGAILRDLNRRRCTIPQVDGDPKPHNVIAGSFTAEGRLDWAVLCSCSGESSILVFKGGSPEAVSEFARSPDRRWLQTFGERRIGYSRMISATSSEGILRYHREHGGPKPPPIDHEGIEDSFVEKGSVFHYCYRGSWLQLTGAD